MSSIKYKYFSKIIILIYTLIDYINKIIIDWKNYKKIPTPKCWPVVGNINIFLGSRTEVFKNVCQTADELGNVFMFWIGLKPSVFLTDPRDVELVLNNHLDKMVEYRTFEPWLGDGVLNSNGQIWKTGRKLVTPTFHTSIIKSFVKKFNENSRNAVGKLNKLVDKEIDCQDLLGETTLEILLETMMGIKKGLLQDSVLPYIHSVLNLCSIVHYQTLKIWMKSNIIFNLTKYKKIESSSLFKVHKFGRDVIRHKQMNMDDAEESVGIDLNENESKIIYPFLKYLLESESVDYHFIKNQVDTILFAGHDTTTMASSFFLSLMGIYPEIQEKVVDELREIFGESDRFATYDDTLDMKYLERCILETLRLYPPVPGIGRRTNHDLKLVSGDYVIPKGTSTYILITKIHRLEEFYPDSNKFNPDNFLPDNMIKRHPYAFIPFSAGPRNCIGHKFAMLELKILLSTIMRYFTIHSDVKEKDFRLQGDIILKRADGFKLRFQQRKFPCKPNNK